jgi:outer membrane lipoprotein-sorting protein
MTNFLRSRLFRSAAVVLAATAGGSTAGLAQANLPAVLKQMDAASTKFQSAEADFRWDLYQRVVRETTTQTGTIYFLKANGGTQMGAKIAPPGAKVVEYKDAKLRLFDPSTDHLTQRSAGGNQAQYESFLTLGFGGSGSDLEKTWNITDQGSESISDGEKSVATEKLDLVAKDPNLRNTFTHVTIWVDPTRGISLKQQFFTPSDDVRTAVYSHIRYNQKVDLGKFAIKTDKKTTVD